MWKWLTALVFLVLLLVPVPALADTSQDVTVTATGWVIEAPGDFTLTYISDYEVGIAWTKPPTANNTMVRAGYNEFPETREDGYLVYYGTSSNTSDTATNLDILFGPVYYVAFSENSEGVWSADFAQASLENPALEELVEQLVVFNGLLEGGVSLFLALVLVTVVVALAFWKDNLLLYAFGSPVALVYGFSVASDETVHSTLWVSGVVFALIGIYFLYCIVAIGFDLKIKKRERRGGE